MANAARKTNWLAIWISAAVVVLIVVIGALVVWMNKQALALAESPATAVVNEETGAIALGEGENVVDEYVDFMCPYCGQFYENSSADLADAVKAGDITLNLHPISILDRLSQGTNYSTRAANAVYCVADDNADAVYPFYDALFQNQPAENSAGLDDDKLLSLAKQAGASGDVESCIADGDYTDFVAARTQEIPENPSTGQVSTPTVTRNGEYVTLTLDAETDRAALLD